VDVEDSVTYSPAITVPLEAVLDSGLRKTVFVERGEGRFEPREVRTGWRLGDKVEIVEGLAAGERVVVSGTFFLDSESRMRAAPTIASGEKRP
jgi:Cu(I)/Ag(I) efflux system membrane fusion protein